MGEIVNIEENEIRLHWYSATYTGSCVPAYLDKDRKQRWIEDINTVISELFKVTKTSRLPTNYKISATANNQIFSI